MPGLPSYPLLYNLCGLSGWKQIGIHSSRTPIRGLHVCPPIIHGAGDSVNLPSHSGAREHTHTHTHTHTHLQIEKYREFFSVGVHIAVPLSLEWKQTNFWWLSAKMADSVDKLQSVSVYQMAGVNFPCCLGVVPGITHWNPFLSCSRCWTARTLRTGG